MSKTDDNFEKTQNIISHICQNCSPDEVPPLENIKDMDFQRKVMVFSVSVLGISLLTFLLAYMVFGDNTDEDMRTLRQTNVSLSQEKFLIID